MQDGSAGTTASLDSGAGALPRTGILPLVLEIEVLGCFGGESPECRLTCLLINGGTALDAGCLCQALPLERQLNVENVVITHSHMDHTNSLPFFVDNVFGRIANGVTIYGSEPTLYSVRKHLFNSASWPDFSLLPNHLEPAIHFEPFEEERELLIGNVSFLPIAVDHVIPTHGMLIESGGSAFLWSSDTGPTQRLWEVANRTPNLKGIGIDVSFDNSLQPVADASGHLTPATLASELEKLEVDVPLYIHHLKPFCAETIARELTGLGRPRVELLEQGRTYTF